MLSLERCPCSGGTLNKLIQPGILTVLAGEPLHGYRIVERLGHLRILGGRKPDATGVYRALKTMHQRGLVTASWDVSEPGPAKHLYRMTRRGRTCLGRWVSTLMEYQRALGQLLGAVKAASAARRRGRAKPRRKAAKIRKRRPASRRRR